MKENNRCKDRMVPQSLVIVHSYHHFNTAKIAHKFAEVLHSQVKTPEEVIPEELQDYDLIGFGAGIDSGKHYKPLLDLADRLQEVHNKTGFIFSTSGIQGEAKAAKDHSLLRQKLKSKGYTIVGEFSCKGFNTNSFLKYFGGMNRGKPDSEDIKHAEEFAISLLKRMTI